MKIFTFQVTLIASIKFYGEATAEAKQRLYQALADASVTLNTSAAPVIAATVEIEGEIDLIDVA